MIRVKNLNKSFHDKNVLTDISVEFEPGKTNLIIGRSGSGKTVLLKSIVGLHNIDSGEIWYENTLFNKLGFAEKKMIRSEIGMLFQGSALFDSLTVEQNVQFPLDMFTDKSPEEKTDRVNFCLNRVNIINANNLFPAELSGGMKKRVALARCLSTDPEILLFDEPTTGQDAVNVTRIAHVIAELRREGKTVITITHDIDFCAENFERVIALANGEVLLDGAATEVFAQEEILAQTYVDPPQLTRLGKKMGLKDTVRTQEEFLNSLRKSIDAIPFK